MGIPRFSKDLSHYSEQVVLGRSDFDLASIQIKRIVIDGPSLVYFVYYRLLAYRYHQSRSSTVDLLSYSRIVQVLMAFLEDLEKHEVDVIRIIFDGALPLSKRDIRFDRLEKTRKQIESFRESFKQFPLTPPVEESDFNPEQAVWTHLSVLSKASVLPPPPFMVPSAIEALQSSRWSSIVQVVADEADSFCAHAAHENNAAILSNDSDLVLYDLGETGCVIQMNSILNTVQTCSQKSVITAQAFRPTDAAKRLNIPSLLHMGFERHRDSSLSTRQVKENARVASRFERHAQEFKIFKSQYYFPETNVSTIDLASLDTRTAELVVFTTSPSIESAHIYLPLLIEDPTRDSSWSYGLQFRQLAYSILQTSTAPLKPIVEYSRRGPRIGNITLQPLNQQSIRKKVDDLTSQLQTQPHLDIDQTSSKFLYWWTFALSHVLDQKIRNGKSVSPILISRFFFFNNSIDSDISWDDIHLHANAEAVLYSLRMLKQLTTYVLKYKQVAFRDPEERYVNDPEDPFMRSLEGLNMALKAMSNIANLFLDFRDFRNKCREIQASSSTQVSVEIMRHFGVKEFVEHRAVALGLKEHETRIDSSDDGGSGQEWKTTPIKQRQKDARLVGREGRIGKQSAEISSSSSKYMTKSIMSQNIFDILQQED